MNLYSTGPPACRRALDARHPPLPTSAPSPSPGSISHRRQWPDHAAVVPRCAPAQCARPVRSSAWNAPSPLRCSCSLHRNSLSPSVWHPESTVAPRTCAPGPGGRPCACPSPPAVDHKSSHTTFSANWPSCCLTIAMSSVHAPDSSPNH